MPVQCMLVNSTDQFNESLETGVTVLFAMILEELCDAMMKHLDDKDDGLDQML